MSGKIVKVSGPLVVAEGLADAGIADIVRVGSQKLIGEILTITGDQASIQVYEETGDLGPGAEVATTGSPLSVELGPGLLENIYDGIQRPLLEIRALTGSTIARGTHVPALSRTKTWTFTPTAAVGDAVTGGSIIGTVDETASVVHKIMVPHGVEGTISNIRGGAYTVEDTVARVTGGDGAVHAITLMQKWPVRVGRPFARKLTPSAPLCSGLRVIDTLFPIAKGGTAAIPGPFSSGKTVLQHQLAKWSDADVVIYIGCGERGNEMADILAEFARQNDPKTGEPLIKRTVLVANTSDMPVAAREASIYTGITIAEYFRDMGCDVAVIADSLSRWAEAMREMSGLLGEMPGDEGYPAYLLSRLARFYERAGCIECAGGDGRRGSLTAIGAISPPGGDTSEPVSQAAMRIVRTFLDLDASLAHAHHFPAVNWLTSYSLCLETLAPWFGTAFGPEFLKNRAQAVALLHEEAELREMARLVGRGALSAPDQLTLETAKMIREDFLQQNAFADLDSLSPYEKQGLLLDMILHYHALCLDAIESGVQKMDALFAIEAREQIGRAKMIPAEEAGKQYGKIKEIMELQISAIVKGGEDL